MVDKQDIQEKLNALNLHYAAELPAKLDTIAATWQGVCASNNVKDITRLTSLCHKLSGSGSSFGFKNVSDNARAIEIELKTLLKKNTQNSTTLIDDDTRLRLDTLISRLTNETQLQNSTTVSDNDKTLVYIYEKDSLIVDELTSRLSSYNYNVQGFLSINDLQQAILVKPPGVVIIDSTLFNPTANKLLINLKHDYQFSVIHLADSSNFSERLKAVRSGANYYFTRPVEFSALIDTLDTVSENNKVTSSKVLIVDDNEPNAQFYSLSLETVGVETKIVTDPFKVMDEVIEFKPDLILLDLHMPKCSGLELAAVIRQQENYISMPIIFLSAETDKEKQLETLDTGADEFLTKPINANHLIAVVKNKIIRYRRLSSYMHNDSLTGLLNHSSVLSTLDTEISRVQRQQTKLSFAMIDIDLFKSINDNYGHHMGDVVIKSLARFIKQNLRVTDFVGRYGGEEFAAILPGIDATTAATVIQKILDSFSQIEFTHFEHKFKVTFSCGIADYATFTTAREFIDAADKALYAAKDAGRNCIRLANSD